MLHLILYVYIHIFHYHRITIENEVRYNNIYSMTTKLVNKLDVKMPIILVSPALDDNAFMSLFLHKNPIMAITAGALNSESNNDLGATIGHELGHLKQQHNRYNKYQKITIILLFLAIIILFLLMGLDQTNLSNILSIVMLQSVPVIFSLFNYWNQQNEYDADQTSAHLTSNKIAIHSLLVGESISSLKKAQRVPRWIRNITMSHPTTVDRVKALSHDPNILHKIIYNAKQRSIKRVTYYTALNQGKIKGK